MTSKKTRRRPAGRDSAVALAVIIGGLGCWVTPALAQAPADQTPASARGEHIRAAADPTSAAIAWNPPPGSVDDTWMTTDDWREQLHLELFLDSGVYGFFVGGASDAANLSAIGAPLDSLRSSHDARFGLALFVEGFSFGLSVAGELWRVDSQPLPYPNASPYGLGLDFTVRYSFLPGAWLQPYVEAGALLRAWWIPLIVVPNDGPERVDGALTLGVSAAAGLGILLGAGWILDVGVRSRLLLPDDVASGNALFKDPVMTIWPTLGLRVVL